MDYAKGLKKRCEQTKLGNIVLKNFALTGITDTFIKDKKIVIKFSSNEIPRYILRYRTLLRMCNGENFLDGQTKNF